MMQLHSTDLDGVMLIEPDIFDEHRGFFMETWNARTFAAFGIEADFVQDNQSRSNRGVLRGIHYQLGASQGKLVRVTAGRVFDVAVDLRRSSPSFGHWIGVELSADNRRILWIPPGFGHGFLALDDGTDFLYKCTDFYAPVEERCIAWNDPDIAIAWPLGDIEPLLSSRDASGASLVAAQVYP